MLLFLFYVNSIKIKHKASGKYLKIYNLDIKTTHESSEASKVSLDEIDKQNNIYIIQFENKVFDNYGGGGPGSIKLYPRHGNYNQRFQIERTDDGIRLKQGKLKATYDKMTDSLVAKTDDSKSNEDYFIFLEDDGKSRYKFGNQQDKDLDISDDKDNSDLAKKKRINRLSDEMKEKSGNFNRNINNERLTNIFLIQRSDPLGSMLSPLPFTPNHTTFGGRKLLYHHGILHSGHLNTRNKGCRYRYLHAHYNPREDFY